MFVANDRNPSRNIHFRFFWSKIFIGFLSKIKSIVLVRVHEIVHIKRYGIAPAMFIMYLSKIPPSANIKAVIIA